MWNAKTSSLGRTTENQNPRTTQGEEKHETAHPTDTDFEW